MSPGFGGWLSSPGNQVAVEFPSGAVDELAVAIYRPVTETQSLMVTRHPVGQVFDLDAVWYSSGEPVSNFLCPVTVTVHYNESDLEGVNETRLALHYWDDGKWVEVPTTLEAAQNRAVAAVSHFTTYALLERRYAVHLPLVIRR